MPLNIGKVVFVRIAAAAHSIGFRAYGVLSSLPPALAIAVAAENAALGVAALAAVGAALWWRKNPSACPYGQRFWVEAPHPLITRDRLREVLAPGARRARPRDRPRHRLLHARHGRVGRSRGQVEIFDLQQEFLDHTMRGPPSAA